MARRYSSFCSGKTFQHFLQVVLTCLRLGEKRAIATNVLTEFLWCRFPILNGTDHSCGILNSCRKNEGCDMIAWKFHVPWYRILL